MASEIAKDFFSSKFAENRDAIVKERYAHNFIQYKKDLMADTARRTAIGKDMGAVEKALADQIKELLGEETEEDKAAKAAKSAALGKAPQAKQAKPAAAEKKPKVNMTAAEAAELAAKRRADMEAAANEALSGCRFQQTTRLNKIFERARGGAYESGPSDVVEVRGWIRSVRSQKDVSFINLNDGSSAESLQCILTRDKLSKEQFDELTGPTVNTGACICLNGTLVKSEHSGQIVEFQAVGGKLLGGVPQFQAGKDDNFPLAKGEMSLEYLREYPHLRVKTRTLAAVARIRDACIHNVHGFFRERGFFNVHTPIITGNDCEGAGECFRVTTLLNEKARKQRMEEVAQEEEKQRKADKKKKEKEAKKNKGKEGGAAAAASAETPAPEAAAPAESAEKNEFEEKYDFFSRSTMLTVSGQLHVETFASGLGNVYTFGPTFRAEDSNTARHLAEFWMIEPEAWFINLNDLMDLCEDFVRTLLGKLLRENAEDLIVMEAFQTELWNKLTEEEQKKTRQLDGNLIQRLQTIASTKFVRLPYKEALVTLNERAAEHGASKLEFGDDLSADHERFLTEKVYGGPVMVHNYPWAIKSFYMPHLEDGTTDCVDVLVPGIGELIGGSMREDSIDKLKQNCVDKKIDPTGLDWYLDLRRFGTGPHGGFGLGFERLVQLATGMHNIRDVIPFPRWTHHCKY